MKNLLFIFLFSFTVLKSIAQNTTTKINRPDTNRPISLDSVKADSRTKVLRSTIKAKPNSRSKNNRALATETGRRPPAVRKAAISRQVIDSIGKADSLKKGGFRDTALPDANTLPNTPKVVDTNAAKKAAADTSKIAPTPLTAKKPLDSFYLKLLDNPYLKTPGKPVYLVVKERQRQSKDEMFYLLAGLLLSLAFLRLSFPKYFGNIFHLFFQPTFRQKQTREQLLQNHFPSLLLNLFFILSGAAYISFIVSHYQLTNLNFWRLFIYSVTLLVVLYSVKFFFLTFTSWVFDVKEAIETYQFAVYLINKILGVLLIPFTFIIAFSPAKIADTAITLSLLLIGLLFVYRYLISFAPILREVKVNAFQFIFYIFAFEIVPLLLIYRSLVNYLKESL